MNAQHQMIRAHKRAVKLAKKVAMWTKLERQGVKGIKENPYCKQAIGRLNAIARENKAAEYLTVLGV